MGLTPWDVVRLIEARKIETIQFVSVESLGRLKGAA
jgi:hypothetical protein